MCTQIVGCLEEIIHPREDKDDTENFDNASLDEAQKITPKTKTKAKKDSYFFRLIMLCVTLALCSS